MEALRSHRMVEWKKEPEPLTKSPGFWVNLEALNQRLVTPQLPHWNLWAQTFLSSSEGTGSQSVVICVGKYPGGKGTGSQLVVVCVGKYPGCES